MCFTRSNSSTITMEHNQNLHELSIAEAGALLRAGALTSMGLTEYSLGRIEAIDPRLHSFVTVTRERALKDAAVADADFKAGVDRGPFQGIPYGLKDVYDTAGVRTTCHSKLLLDNIPQQDLPSPRACDALAGSCSGRCPLTNSPSVVRVLIFQARPPATHGT